jgi:hypothetical protein
VASIAVLPLRVHPGVHTGTLPALGTDVGALKFFRVLLPIGPPAVVDA